MKLFFQSSLLLQWFLPLWLLVVGAPVPGRAATEVSAAPSPGQAAGAATPRIGRVLVVANQRFPSSLEIARAYMRARNLAPDNLLLVEVDDPVAVNAGTFERAILEPVRERLRELSPAVDYIVITRGVPYRAARKSTAAGLMFGGLDQISEHQGFFGQERPFDGSIPVFGRPLHPTAALITYTVEDALRLIDRSQVRYESPDQPGRFYFCEGAGPRGVRNQQITQALRIMRARGARAARVANHNIRNRDDVMAQFTGSPTVHVSSNTYLPGSILDNLTSFGGYLLEETRQSSITTFVQYGVCGAYGTVVEPTNIPTRWAELSWPARYVAGFNLMDTYLQTVRDLSLGVVVGDPLMAPYARPPTIELNWQAAADVPEAAGELQVAADEGVEGQGISWMQIWLNDDIRVGTIVPMLAAGTRLTCRIEAGGEEVLRREHTLAGTMPLNRALAQIAHRGDEESPLEIIPAGRYGGKLLVRAGPQILQRGRAAASIVIAVDDKTYSRTLPLGLQPLIGRVGVIDLSSADARPGDAVRVTMDGEMAMARAGHQTSALAMAQMLQERLESRHPSFGENGQWRAIMALAPPRERVWIIHREATSGRRGQVTVNWQRMPGSQFAAEQEDGRIPWVREPVSALGETVIEPYLPTAEMRYKINVPAAMLATGVNRFHVAAGTPAGAETSVTLEFEAGEQDRPEAWWAPARRVLNAGDELKVALSPPPGIEPARPLLVVNGRKVAEAPAGSREINWRTTFPEMAPGRNDVRVEWRPEGEEASRPAARGRERQIHWRRSLADETVLKETETEAGPAASLVLHGPYLHDGVQAQVAGHTLPLRRDPRFGLRWSAELPPLAPGEYPVRLTGDPDRDQPGVLPEPLRVEPEGQAP